MKNPWDSDIFSPSSLAARPSTVDTPPEYCPPGCLGKQVHPDPRIGMACFFYYTDRLPYVPLRRETRTRNKNPPEEAYLRHEHCQLHSVGPDWGMEPIAPDAEDD